MTLPAKPARSAAPAKKTRAASAKPAYHHGNLRDSLLQSARVLLAERGVQGITLRDIAKAAGVSHAAPYHHFASLDELLAVVAEQAFITLGEAVARAAAEPDPLERLVKVAQSYVACALAQPAEFRLMFGPLLARKHEHPSFKAAAERAFGVMLAAACAYDERNGPELALTGWSLSHGLANLLIDGAFNGLPMKVAAARPLTRALVLRVLGKSRA